MGNGCWEWNGSRDRHGYGRMQCTVGNKIHVKFAHRLAYKHFHPEWDETGGVLHSCDNPSCWNPAHLRTGNQKDNVQDMICRGRANPTGAKGVRNSHAKLSEAQAYEAIGRFAEGETLRSLADRFGVTETNVRLLVTRKSWRHLNA
jgi:hypothetical protein